MPQVKLHHSDNTTDTISETVGFAYHREIGQMRKIVAVVDRDAASNANPEPKSDQIELVGYHTGRLVNIKKGGSTWELIGYGFDWDAKTVPPVLGGTTKSGTDNALLSGLIGDVSSWSEGSLATLTSSMTFVFNHAFVHEEMRRIEKNVPGELRWNADQSVDYVDDLGSDKTASVTLSAANGNILGEITITDDNLDLDATHLRVLGAHEGEAQYFANLVPSGDSGNYENEVTYTTSRWSDSSDTDWGRVENKDVTSQSAIDEEAAALGEELKNPYIEAEATVDGEDLSLGDWVHVEKSDAELDRDMRVHRITTTGGSKNGLESPAAVVDEVLLSTRTVARDGATDRAASIQQFNSGYQGASVWGTVGPVEQNVETGEPLEIPFFYPDIEYENKVEVYVDSRAFRYYVSPADHNHDVSIPSHQHGVSISDSTTSGNNSPDNNVIIGETSNTSGGVTLTGDTTEIASFSITENTSFLSAQMHLDVESATASKFVKGWMEVGSETIPSGATERVNQPAGSGDTLSWTFTSADNHNGDTARLYARYIAGETMDVSTYAHLIAHGRHTHSVSISDSTTSDSGGATTETTDTAAGILTGVSTTNDTVSDADLKVNGSVVHSSIGNGTFQGEFDISNELNTGAWNTIEIDPTGTGRFMASVAILGYRQIGAG